MVSSLTQLHNFFSCYYYQYEDDSNTICNIIIHGYKHQYKSLQNNLIIENIETHCCVMFVEFVNLCSF